MKTNIQQLMNLIAEEEKNFSNLTYDIKSNIYTSSIQELDGTTTIIDGNKESFIDSLNEINRVSTLLSKYKRALYEKNNSLRLVDGRSINSAISDNTNLRKLKSLYEGFLYAKDSKKRVSEVNNSYFECKSINYDIKDIKSKIEEIDKKIQESEFEISKLNSIEFEIEM